MDSAPYSRPCWTSELNSLTGRNVYPQAFRALSRGRYQCSLQSKASTWIEPFDRSRSADESRCGTGNALVATEGAAGQEQGQFIRENSIAAMASPLSFLY